MLPPGHIAGGYLLTKLFFKFIPHSLTSQQIEKLSYGGALLGFLPDLDMFYAFYKSGGWTINHAVADHRIYLTHTPLIWLIIGLPVFFLVKKQSLKYAGLVIWIGAWSHMILDSIEYGVRWAWPFSLNVYALFSVAAGTGQKASGFFSYWLGFLGSYSYSATFYLEIIIIVIAVYTAIRFRKI